jgi:hypothetical protein
VITLEAARADIGRGVVYHPTPTSVEQGVITGVSAAYVFVRYDGDQHAKATAPDQLDWLCEPKDES